MTTIQSPIGLWCSGNTSDFGSEILSSNLDSPTHFLKLIFS